MGVWKELLFNLWTLTFTQFQGVKWVAEEYMALRLKEAQESRKIKHKQQLSWCVVSC